VDHPFMDPQRRMPCHYHGMPGTYMAHTFTTGGIVLKWYRDMFCQEEMRVGALSGIDPYDLLGRQAERVAPGADGLVLLPHLQGAMAPEANPKARGVLYGITLRHTKGHVARAILESIACIVRRNIEVIEGLGIPVKEIRVLGGGARSAVWNQIKADVTGRAVLTMENEEAACLGAAVLAGMGVGVYPSLAQACRKMVKAKSRHLPDASRANVYAGLYENYVGLFDALGGMFAKNEA
jgi:sugar (pentulose or hexulose) kinase